MSLKESRLEILHAAYIERREAIQRRLDEFACVPVSDYFYEMVYCLLTPQSSAANAARAVEALRAHGFEHRNVNPTPLLHQDNFYIRFHHTKGRRLITLKEKFPYILQQLRNGSSSVELRQWLVTNVNGLGYKEASHFLRNIGHRNLAILDRHILRNLRKFGVLRSLPQTLTPKRYITIEKKFRAFSEEIGIPMDELDLLFWSMETGEILK